VTITELQSLAGEFVENPVYGFVSAQDAIRPDIAGLKLFSRPLIGVAAPDNEYYQSIADSDAANIALAPPEFWLSGAKTVISFFFPFDERLRKSNRIGGKPSLEWMHGRVQGQKFLEAFAGLLSATITESGGETVIPQLDARFWQNIQPRHAGPDGSARRQFSTNWSERHVAFGAGLGTFGLAGNLITEKGTAGRLLSAVTTLELDDALPVRFLSNLPGLYDNCTLCGVCVRRCPAGAIGEIGKKDIPKCFAFMGEIRKEYPALHGCGICQVKIPCEMANPARRT